MDDKKKSRECLISLYIICTVVSIVYGISLVIPFFHKDTANNDQITFVKTDGVFIDDNTLVTYNDFVKTGVSDKTKKIELIHHNINDLKTYELHLEDGESITVYGANLKDKTDGSLFSDGAHSIMCYITITKKGNDYSYSVDYDRTKHHDSVVFQWLLDNDNLFHNNYEQYEFSQ